MAFREGQLHVDHLYCHLQNGGIALNLLSDESNFVRLQVQHEVSDQLSKPSFALNIREKVVQLVDDCTAVFQRPLDKNPERLAILSLGRVGHDGILRPRLDRVQHSRKRVHFAHDDFDGPIHIPYLLDPAVQ